MNNLHLSSSTHQISINKIPNLFKSSVTLTDKELFSKYFKRHFIYLEPFYNRESGFYTTLEIRDRLICVIGNSDCCKSDKRITKPAMLNMIKHKIVQNDTDYKSAIYAIYKELEMVVRNDKNTENVQLDIGIISFHKVSGYLDFVGSGIFLNYYKKNSAIPQVYSSNWQNVCDKSLFIHRIETEKGDRFFIQSSESECLNAEVKTSSKFMKLIGKGINYSRRNAGKIRKKMEYQTRNISGSLMIAFTL